MDTCYTCIVDGESCLVELTPPGSYPYREDSFVYVNKQYLFTAKNTKTIKDLVTKYLRKTKYPVLQEAMCQYAQQYYPELLL